MNRRKLFTYFLASGAAGLAAPAPESWEVRWLDEPSMKDPAGITPRVKKFDSVAAADRFGLALPFFNTVWKIQGAKERLWVSFPAKSPAERERMGYCHGGNWKLPQDIL